VSMVQVAGKTYRIVALADGSYDAVRLLDDISMGTFGVGGSLCVASRDGTEAGLLRRIAQTAMRGARTRWSPAVGIA